MMAGNLPVVPSRASLSASGRAAAPSTVRNGGSQRFFGSAHNNVARPVSFQQQTASLRQTMQQNHVGAIPAGGHVSAGESGGIPRHDGEQQFAAAQRGYALAIGRVNNSGNRGAGSPTSSSSMQNANRGGYRPFTPPSSSNRTSAPASSERTNMGTSNISARPTGSQGTGSRMSEPQRSTMPSASAGTRDGFRPFTPPSSSEASRGTASAPASRGSSWQLLEPDRTEFDAVAQQSVRTRAATDADRIPADRRPADRPVRSWICGSRSRDPRTADIRAVATADMAASRRPELRRFP